MRATSVQNGNRNPARGLPWVVRPYEDASDVRLVEAIVRHATVSNHCCKQQRSTPSERYSAPSRARLRRAGGVTIHRPSRCRHLSPRALCGLGILRPRELLLKTYFLLIRRISPYTGPDTLLGVFDSEPAVQDARNSYLERYRPTEQDPAASGWLARMFPWLRRQSRRAIPV